MKTTYLKGLVSEVKENGVIAVAVATDNTIDRDGEIVDASGLDTKNFERNPVLLYAHDYRSDPIGKVLEIRKEGDRVLFQPQLAIDISPRAKMYFEMIKAGILNAFSIGFIPKEWSDRANPDGSTTRVFTKTELLEISLVPVPANPSALVLARSFAKSVSDPDESKAAEEIVTELEKNEGAEDVPAPSEAPVDEPAPSAAPADDTAEKIAAEVKEQLAPIHELLKTIQKQIADNREQSGAKAPTVEELFRHPDFQRAVLRSVDKSIGLTLGRMKRNA